MEANRGFFDGTKNVIIKVEPGSIAEEMDIEPGDILIGVNSHEIKDVFDYRFFIKDEYVELVILKPDGEEWILEIDKDEDEDIGIVFENGLMDNAKSCNNKCLFCFIDQLPQNMRETLYFKDDDSRLSFLQGNYVTLTNMKEEDLERILFYKLSPINISVHTTDMEQRVFMLKNPNAANLFGYMDKIKDSGVEMNFQIVLVNGLNDGSYLDKSIEDLARYMPKGKSLSVVPVGITKHRDNLYPLEAFTEIQAERVIRQVERWQRTLRKEKGSRFVYASDEFYLKAKRELPDFEAYEGFPQIENGVGMLSSFLYEADIVIKKPRLFKEREDITIVTGVAAAEHISNLCERLSSDFNLDIDVCVVENKFFGPEITVSGLLTGQDIIDKLKEQGYHKKILIPQSCLKRDEDIFLDDITLEEMKSQLRAKIKPLPCDGFRFIKEILK